MKKFKEGLVFSGIVLLLVGIFLGVMKVMFASPAPVAIPTAKKHQPTPPQKVKLCAVGDSLTHGVGDTTNKGGYVYLIKQKLNKQSDLQVTTSNYGKTGDRSDQIETRIKTQKQLQQDLHQADVITLTVGGNDLMQVLQKNAGKLLNNDLASVMDGQEQQYQAKLKQLLQTIRTYNEHAPIFLFSVYNPFYVYFPTLTALQKYTDEWNEVAKKTGQGFKKVYFVDINHQLSEGQYLHRSKKSLKNSTTIDLGKVSQQKAEDLLTDAKEKNDFLSSQDHFHPNLKGYKYMTEQLYQVVQAHSATWRQKKGDS